MLEVLPLPASDTRDEGFRSITGVSVETASGGRDPLDESGRAAYSENSARLGRIGAPDGIVQGVSDNGSPSRVQTTVEALRAALRAHLHRAEAAEQSNEFVDLPLARRLHGELSVALDDFEQLDEEQRRVLADAVAYFVRTDDDEDDLRSPIGFDDDAAVVEAALRKLRG